MILAVVVIWYFNLVVATEVVDVAILYLAPPIGISVCHPCHCVGGGEL